MDETAIDPKELIGCLARADSFQKLKDAFDPLLGHPLWWCTVKPANGSKTLPRRISKEIKKRASQTQPFVINAPAGRIDFCVPLVFGDKVIGCFGAANVKRGSRKELLSLLAADVHLVVDNCAKTEELKRLSATVRPRAVALSTVHTVHRIINSTLNLDELISRLAHLTAQVLRANRCAIYLVENPSKAGRVAAKHFFKRKTVLICKALVGYPKRAAKNLRIPAGAGVEGMVALTAHTLLRKKFICLPLIDEDVIGVVKVTSKKDGKKFTYFDREILATLAEEAVIAIKNAQLYEEQKRVTLGTIQSLAGILGSRVENRLSPNTFLAIALKVAEELKLTEEDAQALHYATLLKDTAKVGIPEEILRKPAKLTGEEYRLLREHPIRGAKIVQSFESLKPVVPIILYSREKFDGTGYPEGLKGDKIPIGARVLSVLNAFEAIVMGRPYRDRSSLREALEEIKKNSGTQFDPAVVGAFIHVIHKKGISRLLEKGQRASRR